MGASSWYYFTSYDPDPEAALQRLRQTVFEAGDYGSHLIAAHASAARFHPAFETPGSGPFIESEPEIWGSMQAALNDPTVPPEFRAVLRASLAGTTRRTRPGGCCPSSIEELLDEAAEEGTHSILDITHVANRRTFGAATPLRAVDLQRFFGTDRPTHEQAEERALEIAERLNRWEAAYFVVYRDGQPDEYAFVGCSGN